MIKKTLCFSNPSYLSLKNSQLVIRLPEVECCDNLSDSFKQQSERGCVKMSTSSFLCTKPRLSQARALLFPKVFVPLGIQKISL